MSITLGVLVIQALGGNVFRSGDNGEFCAWRPLALLITCICVLALLLMSLVLPIPKTIPGSPLNSPIAAIDIAPKKDWPKLAAVGFLAMILQNLCGLGTLIFFGQGLLADAGIHAANALGSTIPAVQLVGIACSAFLVDRVGRRQLLIVSSIGMALAALSFGFFVRDKSSVRAVPVMLSLYAYISFFAIGVGPVPWLLLPELGLPDHLRIRLASTATASNWFANFCVTGPPLIFTTKAVGISGLFYIFGGICLAASFLFIFLVPSTRKRRRSGLERRLTFMTFRSSRSSRLFGTGNSASESQQGTSGVSLQDNRG